MKIPLISGKEIEYDMPEPDGFPSSYFFSMERSGSSIFWELAVDLLKAANRSYCEVLEDLFIKGISRREMVESSLVDILKRNGYAFGIFREYDTAFLQIEERKDRQKFLLVRDPRDMMVSLYYSMKKSHRLPPKSGQIEEEILKTRALAAAPIDDFIRLPEVIENIHYKYSAYVDFCQNESRVTLFRYEDVIYNKKIWCVMLAEKLGLSIPLEKIISIVEEWDSCPEDENDADNIRQVRPGNFRKHLQEKTIAYIEEVFGRPMGFFGYVPEQTISPEFVKYSAEFFNALSARLQQTEACLFDLAKSSLQARGAPLRSKKKRL